MQEFPWEILMGNNKYPEHCINLSRRIGWFFISKTHEIVSVRSYPAQTMDLFINLDKFFQLFIPNKEAIGLRAQLSM